jgi:Tol biopolymer transport system component
VARNESTHIGRITLGPRGRPFIYDAMIDEGAADIWLLATRLRRLTSGPGEDHSPAPSPDWRRVAFVRGAYQDRREEGDLLVVPAGGGQAKLLFGERKAAHPSWAPDSRRIAYGRHGGIWIASLATRRAQRLASGHEPAWSRDGRLIVFVHRNSIRTIRPDGTGEGRSQPARGPSKISRGRRTGRRIAYATGWDNDIPYPWHAPEAHFLEIWTVDVASGARQPLVQSAGFNYAPSWR